MDDIINFGLQHEARFQMQVGSLIEFRANGRPRVSRVRVIYMSKHCLEFCQECRPEFANSIHLAVKPESRTSDFPLEMRSDFLGKR